MKKSLMAWGIGLALLSISGTLSAAAEYGGKRSIGVGGGLPYGGLGINYEINNFLGASLSDLTITVGLGASPEAAYSAVSLRYYLFGRWRWVQMVPSLNLCLGYNWEERTPDYRLGIGDGVIFFISKKISLEAALIYEVRFGVLVAFGLRWHWY